MARMTKKQKAAALWATVLAAGAGLVVWNLWGAKKPPADPREVIAALKFDPGVWGVTPVQVADAITVHFKASPALAIATTRENFRRLVLEGASLERKRNPDNPQLGIGSLIAGLLRAYNLEGALDDMEIRAMARDVWAEAMQPF